MKKKIRKICFDIDNVIRKTNNSDYKKSKPILPVIKKINKLYKTHYIILFTADCNAYDYAKIKHYFDQ